MGAAHCGEAAASSSHKFSAFFGCAVMAHWMPLDFRLIFSTYTLHTTTAFCLSYSMHFSLSVISSACHACQALRAFRQGYVTFYKSGKVTFLRSYRCEFNVAGNVTLQGFPLPDANESLAATAQCTV